MPMTPSTGPIAHGGDERELWLYEPFARPGPNGNRSFVIYVYRPDGSRVRAGGLDLRNRDAEAFVEFWRASGARIADREELGLPPSIVEEPKKSGGTA